MTRTVNAVLRIPFGNKIILLGNIRMYIFRLPSSATGSDAVSAIITDGTYRLSLQMYTNYLNATTTTVTVCNIIFKFAFDTYYLRNLMYKYYIIFRTVRCSQNHSKGTRVNVITLHMIYVYHIPSTGIS